MKRTFKGFADFVQLFDGANKPKIDFQAMYKLFPEFTFESTKEFGSYKNFGNAFKQKVYDMDVTDRDGNTVRMVYREYGDAKENLAYVS